MPRPGAAKVVVPKNGIGIAFWIDGVPGSADMVKVEVPSAIAAGISRRGTPATRNSDCAMGREHEERNEQADAAIGDEGAGEHHGQNRAMDAQALAHDLGDGRDRAAILHELAEDGPEQKQRKELSEKAAAAPMKVCVQWARRGSPENAAAMSAAAGASKSTLQPRKANATRSPRPSRMPSRPMASDALQQSCRGRTTNVDRGRVRASLRKDSADERPSSRNMRRKSHSALSFDE